MKISALRIASVLALLTVATLSVVGCKSPGQDQDIDSLTAKQHVVLDGDPNKVATVDQRMPAMHSAEPTVAFTQPRADVDHKTDKSFAATSAVHAAKKATENVKLVSSRSPSLEMPHSAIMQPQAVAPQASKFPVIHTLATDENLVEIVDATPGIVLLDFYADWCGPCKIQAGILHDLESFAKSKRAQIIKVNVEEHEALASQLRIASLPTLMLIKDGNVIGMKNGLSNSGEIQAMLSR